MRAHVVLPDEIVDQIDDLVGKRKRSRFIQEAVEERLRRERLLQAYDDVVGSMKDPAIPEWANPESAAAWVREQRLESDRLRGTNDWLPDTDPDVSEEGEWSGSSSTHQS